MTDCECPTEAYYDALAVDMKKRHPNAAPFGLEHVAFLEPFLDTRILAGFSFGINKALILLTPGHHSLKYVPSLRRLVSAMHAVSPTPTAGQPLPTWRSVTNAPPLSALAIANAPAATLALTGATFSAMLDTCPVVLKPVAVATTTTRPPGAA